MLTPVEIQNRTFKSGVNGYDKKDVDLFVKDVNDNYQMLYRENKEMNEKVQYLNDALKYYKSIEKTLTQAMILAEKTAEETKNNALTNARLIEEEASARAYATLANARNELESLRRNCLELSQRYESYKAQFRAIATSQIEMLDNDVFSINDNAFSAEELYDVKGSVMNYEQYPYEENSENENSSDSDDFTYQNA